MAKGSAEKRAGAYRFRSKKRPSPRISLWAAGIYISAGRGAECQDTSIWTCSRWRAWMWRRTREALPFQDGLFQRIECDAVLEHVRDPQKVMSEIRRVLAPGGYVHLVTPFCHPFHEYPKDYRRFTLDGLKELAGSLNRSPKVGEPVRRRRCWCSLSNT